jgi:hypothetical protein
MRRAGSGVAVGLRSTVPPAAAVARNRALGRSGPGVAGDTAGVLVRRCPYTGLAHSGNPAGGGARPCDFDMRNADFEKAGS